MKLVIQSDSKQHTQMALAISDIRIVNREDKSDLAFVTLVNPATFQSRTYILSRDVDPKKFSQGQLVHAVWTVDDVGGRSYLAVSELHAA